MSGSETENTESEEKSLKFKKFRLKKLKDVKELALEHLYDYVESLHGLIKQHEKKLRKYKDKIRKLTQADDISKIAPKKNAPSSPNSSSPQQALDTTDKKEKCETEICALDAFSFVDEMRQAAQHAQNISNFIYEPTSGLYYDQKSGYYYNAEYGLYYDGNNGCYYSYNQDKKCYEFHSQVGVQPTSKTSKDHNTDGNSFEKHEGQSDDDAAEVIFDEHGVVTDREKLKELRKEKELERLEKERKYKKKSAKSKEEEKKESKQKTHKQRKKSKKQKSSSNSDSDTHRSRKLNDKRPKDVEDGEISSSSTSSSSNASQSDSDETKRKIPIFKSSGRFQDIAKKYPPSLRVVVQETNLEGLKVGSLSLITFKGGSLGREGNHDVIIPDVNVSKFHLKFTYDTKKGIYKCVDLGSRNGTILNGNRMSSSKTESDSHSLMHGSIIQIGQTKLLCHIHEGNSTCGLCEPGLLIETQRDTAPGLSVALSHKEQLKKIQKRYGLENEKFTDGKQQNAGSSTYQDRAATRRLKVGSSSDKEKTQVASVDTAISSDNKGFKMLSKLGWNKGEALGKTQTTGALLEPINVESNVGTKGLGCDDPMAGHTMTLSEKKKMEVMQKTKERYQKADIFSISDDEGK